jgi:hypothetical protein
MGSVLFFVDDEDGYLAWTKDHPEGFVVNTTRTPTPKYMVLHRSGCATITEYSGAATAGGFTEREYAKACAGSIDELKAWVRRHGGRGGLFTSVDCSACQPLYDAYNEWED